MKSIQRVKLRGMSNERLLMLSLTCNDDQLDAIDWELDRRAVNSRGRSPRPSGVLN